MKKIRIGILGYGNLGRGVENAVISSADMELVGVFSRRDGFKTISGAPVISVSKINEYTEKIDVLVLCGGSATDLPEQGPEMLKLFNTVDSFDTHAKIPEYFKKMNAVGIESGKLGAVAVGWDPGLFSIARAMFSAFLPSSENSTFWGRGVSQGHSDAIRRVAGVKYAVQYTVPNKKAVKAARAGRGADLKATDKHMRVCYVVAKVDADKKLIADTIVNMPHYFADYKTQVNFITEKQFFKKHSDMPHGGNVIVSDSLSNLELSIKLTSNPNFTGAVLASYARAVYKMSGENKSGALTVLDVPVGMLSQKNPDELRKDLI